MSEDLESITTMYSEEIGVVRDLVKKHNFIFGAMHSYELSTNLGLAIVRYGVKDAFDSGIADKLRNEEYKWQDVFNPYLVKAAGEILNLSEEAVKESMSNHLNEIWHKYWIGNLESSEEEAPEWNPW